MTVSQPPPPRLRARERGVKLGLLPTGTDNAITDVKGVRVGQVTLWQDEPVPVRTGVTAILPHDGELFREKVVAAAHVINGFGKAVGLTQLTELGVLETPILLTNTLSVAPVMEGGVQHALASNPEIGTTTGGVNVVVAECNDSQLNDMRGCHVRPEHAIEAIQAAAPGPVAEGHVGAGTGMVCYGWRGGIGTSSRLIPADIGGFTVGVLTLANFGAPPHLTIAGRRVGEMLTPPPRSDGTWPPGAGSCIVVIATDAPLSDRQLARLARRAQTGLARTGTIGEHFSGDYALAFTTAFRVPHWPHERISQQLALVETSEVMDGLFQSVVEATDEAVVNALFTADTVVGNQGRVRHGFPVDECMRLLSPG
jgi:D-aminopeptidase